MAEKSSTSRKAALILFAVGLLLIIVTHFLSSMLVHPVMTEVLPHQQNLTSANILYHQVFFNLSPAYGKRLAETYQYPDTSGVVPGEFSLPILPPPYDKFTYLFTGEVVDGEVFYSQLHPRAEKKFKKEINEVLLNTVEMTFIKRQDNDFVNVRIVRSDTGITFEGYYVDVFEYKKNIQKLLDICMTDDVVFYDYTNNSIVSPFDQNETTTEFSVEVTLDGETVGRAGDFEGDNRALYLEREMASFPNGKILIYAPRNFEQNMVRTEKNSRVYFIIGVLLLLTAVVISRRKS